MLEALVQQGLSVSPSVTSQGVLWHHERLTPPTDPDVRLVTSALDLGIVVADLPMALGLSEEKTERLLGIIESTLGVRRNAFVVLAAARWVDNELITPCASMTQSMSRSDRSLCLTVILGYSSAEIAKASGLTIADARSAGADFLRRLGLSSRNEVTFALARAARPASEATSQVPPPGSTVRPVQDAPSPSSHLLGRIKRRARNT